MAKLKPGEFDEGLLDEQDYESMQQQKQAWQNANAQGKQSGMDLAHKTAEAIRAKYEYSGGQDGSEYNPLKQAAGFRYQDAPSYVSDMQSRIDSMTQQMMNRPAFSYDHTTDPTYAQYEKAYTKAGGRAMEDTLGQVSARTGGLASSYATSASQQVYNDYMTELSGKIPELRQLAYEMYQDEGNSQRNNLNMLMGQEEMAYGRHMDKLGQWNSDRNFAYGQQRDAVSDAWNQDGRVYDRLLDARDYGDKQEQTKYDRGRDALGDLRYDDKLSYERGRDQVGDGRYDDELTYGRGRDAFGDARDKADELAAYGDFSGYAAIGYSQEEIANMKRAYQQEQAKGYSGGRTGNKKTATEAEHAKREGFVASPEALGISSDRVVRLMQEGALEVRDIDGVLYYKRLPTYLPGSGTPIKRQ